MTEKETINRGWVISIAQNEVGVIEKPVNNVKYNTWFYGKEVSGAYAWCSTFIMWVYSEAKIAFPRADYMKGYASVPSLKKARKNEIVSEPQPGDLVIFEFNGKPLPDHIGIFDCWIKKGESFYCLEGNTSGTGSQANGGMVLRKKRNIKLVDCFISPKELK